MGGCGGPIGGGGGPIGGGGGAIAGVGPAFMRLPDIVEVNWLRGGKDGGSFLAGSGGPPLAGMVDTLGRGGAAACFGGGGSLSC